MIWCIFIISLGLASARKAEYVEPEHLEALRASGQHEEFARLLGVDVSLVMPNDGEQRSETYPFSKVSELGDMLLNEEQERNFLDFEKWPSYRWPGNPGVVHYVITESDFTQQEREDMTAIFIQFNQDVQNVKIRPRGQHHNDYVQVIKGNGCWSYIGRIGGQQALSIGNGCSRAGTVLHEFMHAMGVTHEQNRHDRDNYVKVLWGNIPQNWRGQYQKVNDDWKDIKGYDYYSVMHYPWWAPDTDGKDAFEYLKSGVNKNRVGQQNRLTPQDIEKLNIFYS